MKVRTDRAGVALNGYDPVAYFTDGKPVRGSAEHVHEWRDATWRFASSQHRQAFIDDPERFAPQFGGYCALGRALGVTVKGSPRRWHIDHDKLYVNKNLLAQLMHLMLRSRIRRLSARP